MNGICCLINLRHSFSVLAYIFKFIDKGRNVDRTFSKKKKRFFTSCFLSLHIIRRSLLLSCFLPAPLEPPVKSWSQSQFFEIIFFFIICNIFSLAKWMPVKTDYRVLLVNLNWLAYIGHQLFNNFNYNFTLVKCHYFYQWLHFMLDGKLQLQGFSSKPATDN